MVAVKPRPLAPGRHLYSMPVDLASRGENATPAQFLPFRPVGYLNTPTGSVPFEILDLP